MAKKILVTSIFVSSMSNYFKKFLLPTFTKKCLITFKFCESHLVYLAFFQVQNSLTDGSLSETIKQDLMPTENTVKHSFCMSCTKDFN